MYLNGELNDADVQNQLGSVLPYVAVHEKEFTRNLELENGEDKKPLSAQELIDRYKGVRDTDRTAKREIINQKEYIRNEDYDIIPINSFEESRKYEKYTNPKSRWCLTYDEDMFDSYTSNGMNQMYFCLKKGFENIQPIVGEGCPRDEYGLSMISVIVDEQGYLAYCTSRWNHDNGGNDHILEEDGLSDLLGVRFPDVFKPNRKFQDALEERIARLKNGEYIRDVFDYTRKSGIDGWYIIELFKRYNVLKQDYTLLCNRWFYNIDSFSEGFARVEIDEGQWNFIDKNGNLVLDRNYPEVDCIEGDTAMVYDDDSNFIEIPIRQSNTQIQETIRINRNDIRQMVKECIGRMLN